MERHRAVTLKKPAVNKKARALWTLKEAKDEGEGDCDPSSELQTESRAQMRQALWEAHVKSPTAALEEALRRTEERAGQAQPSVAGRSAT